MPKKTRPTPTTPPLPQALTEALLLAIPPQSPPAGRSGRLRERLLSRIESNAAEPDFYTLRAEDGEWVTLMPLVEMKLLHQDASGRGFLIRLHPGARVPAHDHAEDEECLVLEGEGCIGGIHLRAGDFHLARKGQPHTESYSETGALLYIRTSDPDYRAGA